MGRGPGIYLTRRRLYEKQQMDTGSMEPTLSVDDLLVIHQESDYTPGDIITFRSGSGLVTHRIVDETPRALSLRETPTTPPMPNPYRQRIFRAKW